MFDMKKYLPKDEKIYFVQDEYAYKQIKSRNARIAKLHSRHGYDADCLESSATDGYSYDYEYDAIPYEYR